MIAILHEADHTSVAKTVRKHKVCDRIVYVWRKHLGDFAPGRPPQVVSLQARREQIPFACERDEYGSQGDASSSCEAVDWSCRIQGNVRYAGGRERLGSTKRKHPLGPLSCNSRAERACTCRPLQRPVEAACTGIHPCESLYER